MESGPRYQGPLNIIERESRRTAPRKNSARWFVYALLWNAPRSDMRCYGTLSLRTATRPALELFGAEGVRPQPTAGETKSIIGLPDLTAPAVNQAIDQLNRKAVLR